jgi:flagellin-like protein
MSGGNGSTGGSGERRAVSPVIGVVLMVAITVVLAALVGTFALGLGGGEEPAPQASFSTTVTDDPSDGAHVTLVHEGGDPIDAARTRVVVRLVDADGAGDDEGDADVVEPASGEAVLTAGTETTYRVQKNDWTGAWSGREDAATADLTDPRPGETVRVTVVDVETGSVVYRETFEVRA